MHVLELYVHNVRPLLNPQCDYLLISTSGTQFKSLTTAMTLLVYEAIGKYIHPTRYRQIIETESSERLTRDEQEMITEDQKHSSNVAKIFYKKKHSRNVAVAGKMCMQKMVGSIRDSPANCISDVLQSIETINSSFDQTVLRRSEHLIEPSRNSPSLLVSSTNFNISNENSARKTEGTREEHFHNFNDAIESTSTPQTDLTITKTIELDGLQPPNDVTNAIEIDTHDSKFVKKDFLKKSSKKHSGVGKVIKFTRAEDQCLKKGIEKYGKKSWSLILKDTAFQFHSTRTRDSLRMRADTATFKKETMQTE